MTSPKVLQSAKAPLSMIMGAASTPGRKRDLLNKQTDRRLPQAAGPFFAALRAYVTSVNEVPWFPPRLPQSRKMR